MAITKADIKEVHRELLKHQLLLGGKNVTYLIMYYNDFIKVNYIDDKGNEFEVTHKGITDEPKKIEEVSAFDFVGKQKLTVDAFMNNILNTLSKLK